MAVINVGTLTAFAFETVVVTNASKALTAATYAYTGKKDTKALISVETDQVRYRLDGGDPTVAIGHILNPMDTLVLENSDQLKNFRAIRVTTDSTLQVTYFKR